MSNPNAFANLPDHVKLNGGPGRPKGSKTLAKPYTHQELAQAAKEKNYNPFIEMIDLARHPDCPFRVQFECHKELAMYLAPKRRAIDVKEDGSSRNLNVQWNVQGNVTLTADQPADTPLSIDVAPSTDDS